MSGLQRLRVGGLLLFRQPFDDQQVGVKDDLIDGPAVENAFGVLRTCPSQTFTPTALTKSIG